MPAIKQEMGKAAPAARQAGDKAGAEYGDSFAKRSGGFLRNVMSGVGMGVGMKLLDGVGGALKGLGSMSFGAGIERSLNVAGAEKKLEGLGHSAAGVEAIMGNALASVKGTAFGMGDAATVAASAVAANIKPGKDLERTLKLVGDTATIAGSGMGEMGAIFNKVASSNKLQGDVIAQLGDRGIPVLQFVAKEMGITTEEVSELARKGSIDFETFQSAMEKGLGGAAQKSGETFEGAMANARAALGRIGESFATPVLQAFTEGFQAAIPAIDSLGGKLEPLAVQFGDWVGSIMPSIISGMERLPDVIDTVGGAIGWLAEGAQSAWSLLFHGEFDGGLFGLKEDHPAVGVMLLIHDRLSELGEWVTGVGVPAFQQLWDGLGQGLMPVMRAVGDYVTGTLIPTWSSIAGVVLSVVGPALDTFVSIITRNVLPVVGQIVAFLTDRVAPTMRRVFEDVALPALRTVADFITDRVLPTFRTIADFISERVAPVVLDFADRVLIPAFEGIAKVVKWAWDTGLYPVLNGIWDIIENVVGPAVGWLWESVFAPTFDQIGDAVEWFGKNWGNVWGGIQRAAAAPVNFVIDVIWNNGLRKLLNLIPGVDVGDPIPTVNVPAARSGGGGGAARALAAYQTGGYVDLPWSASNRDPYLGQTRSGGLFRFEGEEFIVNRDQTRRYRDVLEAINAGDFHVPGYAGGGAIRPVPGGHFGWNGGRYRSSGKWHGGLDFGSSLGNPYGTPIRSMWAGTVSHAARLGRSYGHHAIVNHGGGLQTLYAHMSRLIASVGQAVQAGGILGYLGSTGNSNGPHLHLEVRRNGRQVNPEPYLSGAATINGGGEAGVDTQGQMVTDDKGNLIDLLVELPRQFREIQTSLGEMTSGPWGETFMGSAKQAIGGAAKWAAGKVPGLAELLGFLNVPGFAAGTLSAPSGLAWVGERGPELVDFRGGERVYNARESAALSRTMHINSLTLALDARQVSTFREFADLYEHLERLVAQHNVDLVPIGA
ncbi:peptidoglycan DD-metalloendopeptidase family protein [Tessaracoccus massiliensis]|uniref:peptidoglycan DD-metalloendopeptidase family protein n=1 Tax=Tessaracoccus massiliensis TaxID=1522311 RepID=UPI000B31E14C|nr:peptidoglycan DD-metalloendopeptidase family protein [Tessaracoccus massiliensis]